MREYEFVAKDFAEEKTKKGEEFYEKISSSNAVSEEKFLAYLGVKKITELPDYEELQEKIKRVGKSDNNEN